MPHVPGAAPRLDLDDDAAIARFIVANTRVLAPPLLPEIALHLAEESLAIWRSTEEQLGEMNVAPPYWAFAWAGGQALARHLLDTPDLVRDRTVLDLGCGAGLAGIAAARAGARHVVSADIDRIALVATALNAARAGVGIDTTSDDLLSAPPPACDVLLVGDLFYERELAARVTAFLDAALARGTTVLVGDPQRNYFPKGRLEAVATYKVPVTRDLEDAEIKNAAVWRWR